MLVNLCCSWFVFCFVKIKIIKLILSSVYLGVFDDSVYNESVICECDGAEILRPQHFVVCEHTSIHDDILSRLTLDQ